MRIIVNVSILLLWNGAWVGASWGVKWAAQYPSKLHRLREGQYFFGGINIPTICTETLVCRSFPFKVGEPMFHSDVVPKTLKKRAAASPQGTEDSAVEKLAKKSCVDQTEARWSSLIRRLFRYWWTRWGCSRQHASAISMIKPWVQGGAQSC